MSCMDLVGGYYQCADESPLIIEPAGLSLTAGFYNFIHYKDLEIPLRSADWDKSWCFACERPNGEYC